NNINYKEIKKVIEDMGAAIHSVDEIVAGKTIIDAVKTEQD
ncbi:MAG: hypothetical protein DSY33_04545, partial [Archaeoglobus sp.]